MAAPPRAILIVVAACLIAIVFVTREDYCLESRVGDEVASKHGPGGPVVAQPCG